MTPTEEAQLAVENNCKQLLQGPEQSLSDNAFNHVKFLKMMLGLNFNLPAPFLGLDASHPWMVFWPVNALSLIGHPLTDVEIDRVGRTLLSYQHPNGGFGGGPGQPAHLAATYAAMMCLTHCGPQFWEEVDVPKLTSWIISLKTPEGSIKVCNHGEADPRATYCALASLSILGVHNDEVNQNVGKYISSCQTYEGGFANMPLGEAHGGYVFCSVATLMLLSPSNPLAGLREYCDSKKLVRWLIARQDMNVPGFSGRTNKLVDGCYSHWVGGCWPILEQLWNSCDNEHSYFSRQGLRNYIIKCCQEPKGGLRDKPGTKPDAYHSNYVLCGLATAQYKYKLGNSVFEWHTELALDDASNIVEPINPVYGIPLPNAIRMHEWFALAASTTDSVIEKSTVLSDSSLKQGSEKESDSSQGSGVKEISVASPSSKEYQGFALYVGATVALFTYLLWAFLPAWALHSIKIEYYPSRWWAAAFPAFFLMLMLYIYVALFCYNKEKLTFYPTAIETVCDKDTKVHDVPLFKINQQLYGRKLSASL